MLLQLDDVRFTIAVKLIKYCHEHGIDTEHSSVYYDRLKGRLDMGSDPWVLEIPDHLVTWFRMKYGSFEL